MIKRLKFGENNTAMIKNNITKIIKTLKNDPDYKKPLILIEHSDHPFYVIPIVKMKYLNFKI